MPSYTNVICTTKVKNENMARKSYIAIYILFIIVLCSFAVIAQEVGTASYADALVNIDAFLSEGVEEAASDTAGVATGSIASPTTATTGNEPVPEPLPTEEPAGSEGWMPLPVLPPTPRGTFAEIGKTVRPTGEGTLEVVVTTVREKTPRQVSIMPDRIELWTQDRLLATLEDGEPGVENAFHRRTFSFQPLTLPAGYYYLTIRGFAEGFVTRERKWKGKTVQIGIHDGKTTKLREALSMFVW